MSQLTHKLLSTKEASARSGYHTDYLARLAKNGKVAATRVGRSWLIDEESLSKFIESQEERRRELSQILSRERVEEYQALTEETKIPKKDTPKNRIQVQNFSKKISSIVSFRSHAFAVFVALVVTGGALYFGQENTVGEQVSYMAVRFVEQGNKSNALVTNWYGSLKETLATHSRESLAIEKPSVPARVVLQPIALPAISSLQYGSDVSVTEPILASKNVPTDTHLTFEFSVASTSEALSQFVTQPETLGDLYLSGINAAGGSLTSFALTIRDDGKLLPGVVSVQGAQVAQLTQEFSHTAIATYQNAIYAWVRTTPEVPQTTTLALLQVGTTLHNTALGAPATVATNYNEAIKHFVMGSLALRDTASEQERIVGTQAIEKSQNALASSSIFLSDVISQGPQQTVNTNPIAGTLGALMPQESAAFLPGLSQNIAGFFSVLNTTFATVYQGGNELIASLGNDSFIPTLTNQGERVAVFTYETINDLFARIGDSATFLAELFKPQTIAIIPAALFPENPASTATTTITTTATSTVQTIIGPANSFVNHIANYYLSINGVTNAYLEQRLAEVSRQIVIQILDRRGGQGGGSSAPVDLTHIDGSTITNSTFSGSSVNTTNLTATNATTTTLYATSAYIGDLVIATGTASTTNLVAFNATATNATATNFYATNGTIDNFFATLATITGLNVTNSTTTNATSTNLFSTNASLTNLFTNVATIGDILATNATTTNLIATNATSTNLFSTNGTIANFFSTLATITGLTTTNATTTNFTVASLTAGRVPFAGVGGLLQDSANLLFDGTTLTANTLNLANALQVAYGGTGTTTLSGLLKGNGTNPVTSAVGDVDYQLPITLTTTGSGGPATFIADVLNIPQYSSVSTSTSNTWGGTQTFTNPPVLGTLTGLIAGNNGNLSAVATTTVTCTGLATCSPFTVIGTTPVVIDATTTAPGILGIGPAGQIQNGPNVVLATTTSAFNGLTTALTITASSNIINFLPSLSGTLDNTGLTNSTVSYGGVTLALGQSDATPAFDLTDAFNLPINTGTTGTLSIARGGTNAVSQVTNGVNYFNGTSITSGSALTFDGTQLTTPNFVATNGTTTNATSTNLFATNGTITNLFTSLLNVADLIVGNSTTTNATATNFYATNGTISNFFSTLATITGLNVTNSTTTNATSTNLFSTNGSITNLLANLATITGLTATNATTTNATSTNFFATNGIITNFNTTNATSTNLAITSLTAGRVPFAGVGGLLQDSANLLFDGTTLTANTLTLANALAAVYGGTGQNAVTTGDLLYGSATNTWSRLADIATGNVLLSGGVGVAPSWGKVGLTTAVTGVLPIANGGTATSTQTTNGVNFFDGTSITSNSGFVYTGGNVGIGTTSPIAALQINGSAGSANGEFLIGSGSTSTGDNTYLLMRRSAATGGRIDIDAFRAGIGGTTLTLNAINGGNVGIGTTTPGSLLTLAGATTPAVKIDVTDATSFAQFLFSESGVSKGGLNYIGSAFSDATRQGLTELSGGAGAVAIRAGSAERLRVLANGNVGIGSTTPSAKLVVAGQTIGQYFTATSTTQASTFPLASTTALTNSTALYNSYLTTNRVPYTTTGGLLTDSANMTFDGSTFYVAGDIHNNNIDLTNNSEGDLEIKGISPGVSSPHIDLADSAASDFDWRLEQNTAAGIFQIYSSINTNIFTLTKTTGNLGIANATPGQRLSVRDGIIRLDNTDFAAGTTGTFLDTSLGATSGNTYASIQNWNSGGSATGRLVLNPVGGNVGIGTTNPGTSLHVQGAGVNDILIAQEIVASTAAYNASPQAGILFQNKYTSGGAYAGMGGITVTKENTTDANVASYLSLWTRPAGGGNTERFRITSTGNVGIGTTSPNSLLEVNTLATGPSSGQTFPSYTTGIHQSSGSGDTLLLTNSGATGRTSSIQFRSSTTGLPNPFSSGHVISGFSGLNFTTSYLTLGSSSGNNTFNDELTLNNGKVGIGTSSPNARLHVNGTGQVAAYIQGSTQSYLGLVRADGSLGYSIGRSLNNDNAQDFYIYDNINNGLRLAITSGGNVGIGTSNPQDKLDVNGNISLGGRQTLATDGVSTYLKAGTSGGVYIQPNNGAVTAVSVTPAGNVGIGTTTPATSLVVQGANVAGAGNLLINSTGSLAEESFSINGTRRANIGVDNTGILYFGNQSTGDTQFYVNSGATQAVTIKSSGNVGIGTTTPLAKLEIAGSSVGNSNIRLTNTFSGGRTWELNPYAAGVLDAPFTIRDVTAGANRILIDASGNVGIGTNSPTALLTVGSLTETVPATNTGTLKVTGTTRTSIESVGGIELPVAGDGYAVKIQQISASGAALVFATRNSSATWTETMRIAANSNVSYAGNIVPSTSSNSGGGTWFFGNASWTGSVPGPNSTTGLSYSNGSGSQLFTITSASGQGSLQVDGSFFAGDTPLTYNPLGLTAASNGSLSLGGGAQINGSEYVNGTVMINGGSAVNGNGLQMYFNSNNGYIWSLENGVSWRQLLVDGYPLIMNSNSGGSVGIGATSGFVNNYKFSVRTGINNNLGVRTSGSGLQIAAHNDADSAYNLLQLDGNPIALNVNSGGNVGIGVVSPGVKLTVMGDNGNGWAAEFLKNGSDPGVLIGNVGGTAAIAGILANGSNYSPLALNPSGGNVGINTTGPGYPLDVNGIIRSYSSVIAASPGSNGSVAISSGDGSNPGYIEWRRPNGTRNAYMGYGTSGLGNLNLTLENGANFTINSGNTRFQSNVELDAGSDLFFGREELLGGSDTGGADYGYIHFDNDNNTYAYWGDSAENSALIIGTSNDGANAVSDVLVLKGQAANVFDSPNNIFTSGISVNGDVNGSGIYGSVVSSSQFYGNGQFGTTGSSCDSVDVSAGIVTNCSPFSDARLKTVEGNVEGADALDKLSTLSTVYYNWNQLMIDTFGQQYANQPTQLGFLAQNVKEVFPEAVTQSDDGYYHMNYSRMTVVLVAGVNELNARLDSIATTSDFETGSFAEKFWTSLTTKLIAWFADTTNGIGDVFAKKVNTGELCVSDSNGSETCITKTQLDNLLAGVGASGSTNGGGTNNPPANGGGTGEEENPPQDNQNGQDGAPTITLSGSAAMELSVGDSFSDPGATATDTEDGDLTSSITVSGSVDSGTAGSYTLTYSVMDSNGHYAEVSRMVVVAGEEAPEGGDQTADAGGEEEQAPVSAPAEGESPSDGGGESAEGGE